LLYANETYNSSQPENNTKDMISDGESSYIQAYRVQQKERLFLNKILKLDEPGIVIKAIKTVYCKITQSFGLY
jgi:hypothetical protein